jgi:type I restriction enzyme S subunit
LRGITAYTPHTSKGISKMISPNLRFKEFYGSWSEEALGTITSSFKSGEGITSEKINAKDLYPVFGGNGLRGYTDKYTHDGCYILIGRQGALCGNIKVVEGKNFISEHAIAVKGNSKSDTKWLSYKLDLMKLNRLSESSAQPGLAVNKLLKLNIAIPPTIQEQEKIALFLSSVDQKISLLTQEHGLLIAYRKSVMMKIFKQEIRFKDLNGVSYPEWRDETLGAITTRVKSKNSEDNQNVLTISAQQGLVNQQEYFTKSVSAKDVRGYYLLERDDFAYNRSYSKGYPMGAIKRLKLYPKGVVSTLYICFKFNQPNDPAFFEHYFESGIQNREIEGVAQEGARNHGLLNVGLQDFFNIQIKVPSLYEQRKIASFLSAIDEKIANVEQQLELTKQYKQGLLQQMFV